VSFKGVEREWRHGSYVFKVQSPPSTPTNPRDTFIIDASCISVGPSCTIEFHFVYALSGGLLAFTRQQAAINPGTKARPTGTTYIVSQAPGFFPHKGR